MIRRMVIMLLVGMLGSSLMPMDKASERKSAESKLQEKSDKAVEQKERADEQKRRDDETRRRAQQQADQRVREPEKSEKVQPAVSLSDTVLDAAKVLVDVTKLYDKNDSDGGDKLVDSLINNKQLSSVSREELKKAVAGSSWSRETRFSMIAPLVDALVKRRALKGENSRYERVFVNYIDALLGSFTVQELQHLLENDTYVRLMHDVSERLGSIVREPPIGHQQLLSAEYLFYIMADFVQKLIKALPSVADDRWYDQANLVAQWIGELPVEQPEMLTYMRNILKNRPVRFIIPDDYKSLRALLRIFKGYDEKYVDALKMSFLQAARASSSLEALREALLLVSPLPNGPRDALLPVALDVQQAYLKQMLTVKGLEKITTGDALLMSDAINTITSFNKEYASRDVVALLKNISTAIKNVEVQEQSADAGKKKDISTRIKLLSELFERAKKWYTPALRKAYLKDFGTVKGLRSMQASDPELIINTINTTNPQNISDEIADMVTQLPAVIKTLTAEFAGSDLGKEVKAAQTARLERLQDLYVMLAEHLLPEHGLPDDVWKKLVAQAKARKQVLKPALLDKNPVELNAYLFKMDPAGNYDVGQALRQFVKVYNLYEQFPEVQKVLLSKIQALMNKPLDAKTKQAFIASIALAPDVQVFLYKIAVPLGLLGYTNTKVLRNELVTFAHDQSLVGEYQYMLRLSPDFVNMAGVYNEYFFNDSKSIQVFYGLLKLMPDRMFERFIGDIDPQHYNAKDVGILFNALSELDAPRARVLLDALKRYKKAFAEKYGASGFSLSDKLINDADAQISARLKSSSRQSTSTNTASRSTASRSSVSVSDVNVRIH